MPPPLEDEGELEGALGPMTEDPPDCGVVAEPEEPVDCEVEDDCWL